jgi:adenylate cyclase
LPIEKYAAGHGLLNLTPEIDGIVRRVPAFFRLGKKLYPTLAVESMRVYSGRRGIITKGTQSGISDVIISKKLKVPTDKNGRMWPYFSRSDKSKYISAVDVLNGVADPNKIKGKIALVGTSAAGLLDIKTVPTFLMPWKCHLRYLVEY